MRSGPATALLLAALLVAFTPTTASAHAGLVNSDPTPGAALGGAPTAVQLSFSEQPEAALSSISVTDVKGVAYQSGPPARAAGDPRSLVEPLRPLGRGVYTVNWRVDSAVDGHATSGGYTFGVGVPPGAVPATSTNTKAVSSLLEVVARWTLLVGLAVLLGVGVAGAARFGGEAGTDVVLGGSGWLFALIGLLLLGDAQRQSANSSVSALLHTPVGHALIWRGLALAVAGGALVIARRVPRGRRLAFFATALAALAAIIVHVANGHAGAGSWTHAITVTAQVAHFAAAGVWFGGLAALLLGLRGAPSPAKAAAVRRYAVIAAVSLFVVLTTGIVRAISALDSVGELVSTSYGRIVLLKLALVALIAVLGLRNRRVGVPAAAENLRPLLRVSSAELTLATGALVAAALLGTLAPPAAQKTTGLRGLTATGSDLATTVRVRLSAVSDQPGPNRFTVHIEDYDSGAAIRAAAVGLTFTPLDDPGVVPTTLPLSSGRNGDYIGAGAGLPFDGRWRVGVEIQRANQAFEVPLELNLPGAPQQQSIERIPGQDPKYTNLDGNLAFVRISPHPERAGPSEIRVTCYTANLGDVTPIDQLVVTAASRGGSAAQAPVRRLGAGSFMAIVNLAPGSNTIAVTARMSGGTRLHSNFDLKLPDGA